MQLLEYEPLSAGARGLIKEALASGEVLTALVSDILDVAMIDDDRLELAPEAIDAETLLTDVTATYRRRIEAKGLQLRVEAEPVAARVWVDPVPLRQVLDKLIGNAAKFTHEGGVTVSMRGSGGGDAHRLRIRIEDTGVGVSAPQQAEIFERFRQVDGSTTRRFGGAGLGLTIARRLVEKMGGTIGVESRPEQGSTFWIDISAPLVPAEITRIPDVRLAPAA